jgi:hypothetical protein
MSKPIMSHKRLELLGVLWPIPLHVHMHALHVPPSRDAFAKEEYVKGRGCLNQHFKLSHIHMAMWFIYMHISL